MWCVYGAGERKRFIDLVTFLKSLSRHCSMNGHGYLWYISSYYALIQHLFIKKTFCSTNDNIIVEQCCAIFS